MMPNCLLPNIAQCIIFILVAKCKLQEATCLLLSGRTLWQGIGIGLSAAPKHSTTVSHSGSMSYTSCTVHKSVIRPLKEGLAKYSMASLLAHFFAKICPSCRIVSMLQHHSMQSIQTLNDNRLHLPQGLKDDQNQQHHDRHCPMDQHSLNGSVGFARLQAVNRQRATGHCGKHKAGCAEDPVNRVRD